MTDITVADVARETAGALMEKIQRATAPCKILRKEEGSPRGDVLTIELQAQWGPRILVTIEIRDPDGLAEDLLERTTCQYLYAVARVKGEFERYPAGYTRMKVPPLGDVRRRVSEGGETLPEAVRQLARMVPVQGDNLTQALQSIKWDHDRVRRQRSPEELRAADARNRAMVRHLIDPEAPTLSCPKGCGNQHLSRKYAAFYAPVNEIGDDIAPEGFHAHESETELTDDMMCRKCGHEWTSKLI